MKLIRNYVAAFKRKRRGVEIFRSDRWNEVEDLQQTLRAADIEANVYEITAGVAKRVTEPRYLHAEWSLRARPDEAERAFRYLSMAEYNEPDAYEDDLPQPVLRRRPFFKLVALLIALVFGVVSFWYALW